MDETEHDVPALMDFPRLTGCVLAGFVVAGQSALLHFHRAPHIARSVADLSHSAELQVARLAEAIRHRRVLALQ